MQSDVKRGWKNFQRRQKLSPIDGDPGRKTLAAVMRLEEVANEFTVEAPSFGGCSYGGASIRKGVHRDPKDLIPAFAQKIELLFQRLRALGHNPLLWEAYRSPERAAKLKKKGTGIKQSMHCLGAAVDIVEDDSTQWDPETHGFWDDIGNEAEKLGLVVLYKGSGKKRRRFDRPHVQALPVSMQAKFRRMTEHEREEYITKRLAA